VQQVAQWVSSTLDLPEYADVFCANAIDGRQLCALTAQRKSTLFDFLRDTLQITSWGHRKAIVAATSALVADQSTVPQTYSQQNRISDKSELVAPTDPLQIGSEDSDRSAPPVVSGFGIQNGRPEEDGGDEADRYGKVVSGYGIQKADDSVLAARK
jgi:hypothetical protein